jgi:hypothetical protein
MKTLYRILKSIAFYTMLLTGCTKTEGGDYTILSQTEISFSPSFSATAVDAKSFLYDDSNIIQEEKGNFMVTAYKTGTSQRHFRGFDRIYYFKDAGQWRFYDKDENDFYKRYWPESYGLDFFAYMPYVLVNCHVTPGGYTEGKGPAFSCNLPTDQTNMEKAVEFVYAYATGQTAETAGGNVNLTFVHPLSAVVFKLGNAHGNTKIHSIGFKNLYHQGTFTVSPSESIQSGISAAHWTITGSPAAPSITVDRIVPDLQIGSTIGGPYLVIPQSISNDAGDVKLTISFTWNDTPVNAEVSPATGTLSSWEPGKKYTYTLNLGDPMEDVIAKVSVEPWKGGYDNDINVQ